MKKSVINAVSGVLIVIFIFTSVTFTASAASYTNSKGNAKVVCGSYSKTFSAGKYGKNFSAALNKALQTAGKKAKNNKKATVTISKGKYKLDRTIFIYSNTKLVASGSSFKFRGNHIKNAFDKNKKSAKGYKGAKNITVTGGTWDALVPYSQASITDNDNLTHSTFRFSHCKNIVIKNCTFKNNYNCHDIEMGGVNGATITKCKFTNSKSTNKLKISGGIEAVQVDVNNKKAVPDFPSYDSTPCKNITICNNSFKNKYRAIGSHHAVVGKAYDKIYVYGNTIKNSGGIAINAIYWTNSKIYNNNLSSVASGIDYYSFSDHNIYNTNKVSHAKVEKVLKSSKTYIYGNTISVRKNTNTLSFKFGIRVKGAKYSKKDKVNGVNKGTYNIYNAYIGTDSKSKKSPNRVSGSFEAGISAGYAVNTNIAYNSVNMNNCAFDSSFGIFVTDSKNTVVKNNTVKHTNKPTKFTRSGATIRASKNTEFMNNTINCYNYGMQILYGSTGINIHDNTITSLKSNCVYLSGKEDPTPNTKKTLTVINNKFSSLNTFVKEDAALYVLLDNIDVNAYSNDKISSEDKTLTCAIKGNASVKCTITDGEIILKGLTAYTRNNKNIISWEENLSASGYSVYRVVNGKKTFLANTTSNFYEDTYSTQENVSYRIVPYVTSIKATLYSLPQSVSLTK